jgi:site-specific DNA-methyltransferase (adenine-specific)
MLPANQIIQGDCLQIMPQLPDKSIDMILCDLPYGTTQNRWDTVISLDGLWAAYKRIIKDNGAIILTAAQPFTSILVMSNPKMFKYEWIWVKDNGTGFLNAKKQPLRNHESVLVFYKQQPHYQPQMRSGKPYKQKSGATKSSNYGKQIDVHTACGTGDRYPLTVIPFTRDKGKAHPTQKPVALFEYLIKTYTNAGEIVLDNCIGSGTTAVACINTGRRFIGIEQDEGYCQIARQRIQSMFPPRPSPPTRV